MTRDEYDSWIENCKHNGCRTSVRIVYINSLEQRIAELEATKTCEGCKHSVAGGYDCTHWSSNEEDCCIRFSNPIDYYEKETV